MLKSSLKENESIRFSTSDVLEQYVAGGPMTRTAVSHQAALEEAFFLGLRLTNGIDLEEMRTVFGNFVVTRMSPTIADLAGLGLIDWEGGSVRLTPRGRLLSNEVFERFLMQPK
jgi:oxygen-independent coproporphyrinogen-3 oxidase